MPNASDAAPTPGGQWQVFREFHGVLLNTPKKAVDFGEAVVRAFYGQAEVDEERPFAAEDLGDAWRVTGSRFGTHAIGFFPSKSTVVLRKATAEILDFTNEMFVPDGPTRR